jgi:AcrR family transcriptional regulator
MRETTLMQPVRARGDDAPSTSSNGRGRRRDEEFDGRILQAGFDELSRSGISHFSVAAVARRAGVSKGSIYLRWPTREQLIFDCAVQLRSGITRPGGANLRDDLEELAGQYASAYARPRAIEVLLRIDADRDDYPELFERIFAQLQEAGNKVVRQVIIDAQTRGEVAPAISPNVFTRMFVGALFVEALAQTPAGHIGTRFRGDLVDFLVAALTTPTFALEVNAHGPA